MASYTGGAKESSRITALEEERKQRKEELERKKGAIAAASSDVLSTTGRKFSTRSETVEDLLRSDTVGLVTHEDYKARRKYLERCAAEEREKREAIQREIEAESRKQRLKRANKATLSFTGGGDDDDDDSDVKDDRGENGGDGQVRAHQIQAAKRRKLGKNPNADTTFLPDREREIAEQAEREKLRQQWLNEQERVKKEVVRITYSYWDGAGHRRVIRCKKGTTVGRFLSMVQAEFKELRNVSADTLMFIKEDLIIPHHYSFYDFIVSKARGKSGPLFNFDVVEDVRLVNDAKKEKEDAHAAKVVDRRWYERNRHIFPASRWEVYDPQKKYDRYTIHDAQTL